MNDPVEVAHQPRRPDCGTLMRDGPGVGSAPRADT